MSHHPSRRRFIGITAAAAGLGLLPFGRTARAEGSLVTWQGQAMGAMATIQIHHRDRAAAGRLIEKALTEVRRLEEVFSLYRDDSALSVLNRQGILVAPPAELVELLSECRRQADLTDGVFDPTVQALWTLYRNHFSQADADPQGPPETEVEAALAKVGFSQVAFSPDRVALPRRGMGLTLNGIAQGYATDRVVELLRSAGIENTLIDMGEPRAVGSRPSGEPWRIGVSDPDHPEEILETFDAVDKAVATSGSYGFRFDSKGCFNHLFDPRTGGSAHLYRSVTVVMPTATAADALSTAFSLMPPDRIANVLARLGVGRAHLINASGERTVLHA